MVHFRRIILNFWTKESCALRAVRVRLLSLTCRVADRPAPPEMTQCGHPAIAEPSMVLEGPVPGWRRLVIISRNGNGGEQRQRTERRNCRQHEIVDIGR
jgi:hypothetical protein